MIHRCILIGIAIIAFTTFGCENSNLILDNIVEIDNIVENETNDTTTLCKVGDILTIGQQCQDPNTDATFTVTTHGNGKYTSKTGLLFEATDVLDTTGSTLNGRAYNFIARKQNDGKWKIETITHAQ